jgi:glutaminase
VNASQLARMGATLANNGVNPTTRAGHQAGRRSIHSLRHGDGGALRLFRKLAWHVGLPAKSGVGGGIVAIAPGKGAIAVFAPPLGEAGNCAKAQEVIDYVAQKLNYNLYSPSSVGLK